MLLLQRHTHCRGLRVLLLLLLLLLQHRNLLLKGHAHTVQASHCIRRGIGKACREHRSSATVGGGGGLRIVSGLGLRLMEQDVLLLLLLLLVMERQLMLLKLLLLIHRRGAHGNILHKKFNESRQKTNNTKPSYLHGLLQQHNRLRLSLHHAGGQHLPLLQGVNTNVNQDPVKYTHLRGGLSLRRRLILVLLMLLLLQSRSLRLYRLLLLLLLLWRLLLRRLCWLLLLLLLLLKFLLLRGLALARSRSRG